MAPKAARPPKKGSAAAAAAKEAKAKGKGSSDDLTTVFKAASLADGDVGEYDDCGRVATGTLISEVRARDIKINCFSLALHGKPLVEDTIIELNCGARYGLLGRNGCGKSTFLRCLANREVPIPMHFDIYLLDHEAPPCEQTALEYVVTSAQEEVARLDALIENILVEDGPESELLGDLYEKQDELDPSTFETRASTILVGLGFKPAGADLKDGGATVDKKCKDMSGGWRMRVALAKALFKAPSILLLDEPTNVRSRPPSLQFLFGVPLASLRCSSPVMTPPSLPSPRHPRTARPQHLDLEACVWLEDYLSTYNKTLIVISHSQDFLNGVCTAMMVMQEQKLRYWSGNFDAYTKTRNEQETNQIKLYKKQQVEISEIKQFIASCGTYANLVRQAKSREKILEKMEADGLLEMPYQVSAAESNAPIYSLSIPICFCLFPIYSLSIPIYSLSVPHLIPM